MRDSPNVRNTDLAQIHIAATQLGMDTKDKDPNSVYRSVLFLIGRKHSAAELDYHGRKAVLEHFKSKGWKPQPAKKSETTKKLSNKPQHKMIRGLWLELNQVGQVLDPSEDAIHRFVKNQLGVDRLEWLEVAQASKIIETLKSWLTRVNK